MDERHEQRSDSLPRHLGLRLLMLTVASCASMEADRVQNTEQRLSAAGFHVKPADTPEKLANLQAMTQRKLVMHPKDDKVVYVYADAKYCKCAYVGPEAAYQRYQQLAVQERIAEDQWLAAEENAGVPMHWSLWGPWPGW